MLYMSMKTKKKTLQTRTKKNQDKVSHIFHGSSKKENKGEKEKRKFSSLNLPKDSQVRIYVNPIPIFFLSFRKMPQTPIYLRC